MLLIHHRRSGEAEKMKVAVLMSDWVSSLSGNWSAVRMQPKCGRRSIADPLRDVITTRQALPLVIYDVGPRWPTDRGRDDLREADGANRTAAAETGIQWWNLAPRVRGTDETPQKALQRHLMTTMICIWTVVDISDNKFHLYSEFLFTLHYGLIPNTNRSTKIKSRCIPRSTKYNATSTCIYRAVEGLAAGCSNSNLPPGLWLTPRNRDHPCPTLVIEYWTIH